MVDNDSSQFNEAKTSTQILIYKACHDELLQTLRYLLLMPYPWKQTSITKKMNFRGQLSYLPCSYMAKRFFNIRLTHFQHVDNQSLGFIPILTEYLPSMLYTEYLIDIYQMECFRLSVHGKESFMKRLFNEVNLNFFMNVSGTIPLSLH